jgi:predicted N-acetyltransferase YhbS
LALKGNIQIRPLRAEELTEADRIVRLAFGTFIGLPEPQSFMADAAYVRSRWIMDPSAAFAAEVDGSLAGSNFAANWGSVGFFGPLSIRPDLWDRKIGQKLMEPVLDCFSDGKPGMLACSLSLRAQSMLASTKNTISGRAF